MTKTNHLPNKRAGTEAPANLATTRIMAKGDARVRLGQLNALIFTSRRCSKFFCLATAAPGSAAWRTQNLAHRLPVDIRVKVLASNSCNLLDVQAPLHRDAARHPVSDSLRLCGLASRLGQQASELRDPASLLDCIAKSLCAGVWVWCLHAHKFYTTCEFSQSHREFLL